MHFKTCIKCGKEKPEESFPRQQRNPVLRRNQCFTCRSEKRTPKAAYRKGRKAKWKKLRIDIDFEKYEEMVRQQEGKCLICGKEEVLAVDHDHKTGKVRGLLCKRCNLGIGQFDDDPEKMMKAVKYLQS